ncbi:TRAP transporter permease [Mailhella sp.]|uniref:TRAP transporter permease n=1 Tax=Mailhella sp. TaxID=1981029 RepID=UPI0040647E6B
MSHKHIQKDPAGDKYKEELVNAEHGMRGDTMGITAKVTFVIALCWSLFQMATASFLLLDSVYVKSIHLAFAISLVYLNIPLLKPSQNSRWDLRILLAMNRVTVMDYILGIMAAVAALYIFLDYAGISSRPGDPNMRDILMGVLLVVLLLEGTRRVLGPALPVISSVFILYVFTGPYLPDFIAFKGASLTRFISQITMDTQGVYGIPLQVSATVVFLFVLFGTMLDRAGGGTFFTQLAISGLGKYRGGAAKAAVFSSALSGMVSGSSIANVVTTGTFTIPLMKKVGYPAVKAAAIEVASSVNGQLAPPVMGAAAFIIAEYVNVPYVEVAKAAAVPAFASYSALLWITHVEACKLGLRGLSKDELPRAWLVLRNGLHFLLPLGMLLYELIALQHSAELSVFRAICVLSVIIVLQPVCIAHVHKTSKWAALKLGVKNLLVSMAAGANNMAGVALATASAGIIVGCVSLGLGQQITSFVEILSMGNIFLLLFITAAASLLLGMGLPTTANYIIMASLTAPVLVELASGFSIHGMQLAVPLMAAHLYCFYFGILADDTPPVGLAAYAGAAIANASPIAVGIQGFFYDIRTALLPLVFIFNHDIILWNISSVPLAFFIFAMTSLGMICFTSLVQGWFVTRTNIFDKALLLAASVILMYPALLTGFFLPHEQRHYGYAVGIGLMLLVYLRQKASLKFMANKEAAA